MPRRQTTEAPAVETVQQQLDALHDVIFGAENRMKLRYVRYADIREQDINANVMPVGMFNALVQNVRKNAALESLPLCATRAETPNRIEVVSGHHRLRAAMAAGLTYGVVLCYDGLTDSEIKAKQLAHNSIQGSSDPEIVREIFARIHDVESQLESYIDPEIIGAVPDPVAFTIVDIDPLADAKTVVLVFLPTQFTAFERSMDLLKSEPDTVYVAHQAAFDGFRDALRRTRTDLDVLSMPTAIVEMARLATERLNQLQQERETAHAVPETERPMADDHASLVATTAQEF
jgi:hypothetical protein